MSHLFVSRFNNQYVTIVIILFVFLSTKLKNVHSLARHGGIWWLHVEIFFKTSSCAFESRKGKKCKNNWKATFEEKTGKLSSIAKVNRSVHFFYLCTKKICRKYHFQSKEPCLNINRKGAGKGWVTHFHNLRTL